MPFQKQLIDVSRLQKEKLSGQITALSSIAITRSRHQNLGWDCSIDGSLPTQNTATRLIDNFIAIKFTRNPRCSAEMLDSFEDAGLQTNWKN